MMAVVKVVFTVSCMLILSACSSIPILVPDMAMQSKKPITFENAQGPISHAQSKKILEKLKKNTDETSIFDQHLALIS